MWRNICERLTWENREKCMDMKNVAHLVALMAFSSSSDEGFECVKQAALCVFGSDSEIKTALTKVTNLTNKMENSEFLGMMGQSAIGAFALLKADLEADALKEKENAS